MKTKQLCYIRKDLQKEKLGMPLHNTEGQFDKVTYIYGGAKREYRWLGDTSGFQVKYRNKWFNAYSIDFDFLPQPTKI